MIFYKLEYLIEKLLNSNSSQSEQRTLQEFVGRKFSTEEAKFVWERVLDHKWHLSESLNRDVGLRVAANDYIENFYEPHRNEIESRPTRIPFKVFSQYDFFANVLED